MSEWIPCDERLPGNSDPVLVWSIYSDVPAAGQVLIGDYSSEHGWWIESGDSRARGGITHWMPRPERCPECGMKDGDTKSGPLGGVYIIEDGGGAVGIDWVWCTECHRSFTARLETGEDDSVVAHDAVPADMPL